MHTCHRNNLYSLLMSSFHDIRKLFSEPSEMTRFVSLGLSLPGTRTDGIVGGSSFDPLAIDFLFAKRR